MQKFVITLLLILVGGGLVYYVTQDAPTKETLETYHNADLGISFAYRVSPDGYTLIERDDDSGNANIEKVLILMNTREYEELMDSDIPREGPPGISVTIFDNASDTPVSSWIESNTQYSLLPPGLTLANVAKTIVDGLEAITYTADGLYHNDVVVLSQDYMVYLFIGAFNDPADPIRTDFREFLDSISFL